ncbi:MAG: aminopeptidase [Candidatus Xenobia bacterium]
MGRKFAIGAGVLLLLALLLAQSAEVRYLVREAGFELHMLRASRPIAQVLADPAIPAAWKQQLELVEQVKAFGINQMGEAPSDSYQSFYDTGGRPVGWALQAAPRDRLQPYQWTYPILGAVPYKGFATRAEAEAAAVPLMEQGYDTVVWPIPAFSTLGWLPDPVTSNLLEEDPSELGATILHELFHGTVYWPGDASLNETMAQFVGMAGIQEFFPAGSVARQHAADAWADEKTFTGFINGLTEELRKVYAAPLPLEEKMQRRREVLREAGERFKSISFHTRIYRRFRPALLNNASLMSFVGYHKDLDMFQQAYDLLGHRAALLVAFLRRVDPHGGLARALRELRAQGTSAWLESHPDLPSPIARHTVMPRLPAAGLLLLLVLLRAVQLRRHPQPGLSVRIGSWLAALGALAGLVSGALPQGVVWLLLTGLAALLLGRQRMPGGRWLIALETLLLGLLGGSLWMLVPLAMVLGPLVRR